MILPHNGPWVIILVKIFSVWMLWCSADNIFILIFFAGHDIFFWHVIFCFKCFYWLSKNLCAICFSVDLILQHCCINAQIAFLTTIWSEQFPILQDHILLFYLLQISYMWMHHVLHIYVSMWHNVLCGIFMHLEWIYNSIHSIMQQHCV